MHRSNVFLIGLFCLLANHSLFFNPFLLFWAGQGVYGRCCISLFTVYCYTRLKGKAYFPVFFFTASANDLCVMAFQLEERCALLISFSLRIGVLLSE
jgi:hypothetical protein